MLRTSVYIRRLNLEMLQVQIIIIEVNMDRAGS